jgi:hypothetical protein
MRRIFRETLDKERYDLKSKSDAERYSGGRGGEREIQRDR